MPSSLRWVLRTLVGLQIGLVAWDTVALLEPYGLRRTQFDGIDYLQMAHALLRGEGLKVAPIYEPAPYRWVTEWPAGYPALIAVSATLTHTEPFYASRLLNLALYVATYVLLWAFFRPYAEWLFLLLWPPNLTWTVSMVLSENLFFPLLVATVGSLSYHQQRDERWGILLWLLLPCLFLTRYAGIAVGIAVGIWGAWLFFQGLRRKGLILLGAAVSQAVIALAYFAWNTHQDPTGESGLHLRLMPMPAHFLWEAKTQTTFWRYGAILLLSALLVARHSPLSEQEKNLSVFLGLLTGVQLLFYLASMVKGRVGMVEERHIALLLLPALWIGGVYLWGGLPSWAKGIVAIGIVLWQARNTYRHAARLRTEQHFSYAHLAAVQRAYDTLPPYACIIAGNLGYSVLGKRKDLSLGHGKAYWPILLRRCSCLYIDCGKVEARYRVGLSSQVLWPFVRFCEPTQAPIALRRILCVDSAQKNLGGSR